jgi:hypothetical protein
MSDEWIGKRLQTGDPAGMNKIVKLEQKSRETNIQMI